MTPAAVEPKPVYQFKAGRHSSHALLLSELPQGGQGRRVLDLGCAGGYLSEALAARGYAVTSVDQPGTPHAPGLDFVGANLNEGLRTVRGSFDFIVCADVLEHLCDPLRLLRDCRGVLAPDGVLLASLPNSGNAYFRWKILMGQFPQHDRGLFDRTHLHFYTWDGWVDLLARSGFRMEGVRASGVPVSVAFDRPESLAWVRTLEWLSFELARLRKRLFAYQFIVRARPELDR
jgi:SAM-dependent methyltransferase